MQAGAKTVQSVNAYIDSAYNYINNAQSYQVTFLEFGSTGCSACKRMEKVMDDIRRQYPDKVNVVFYNITYPKNRKLMKYYGVSVIPTQILLDAEGEEFFRHTGYIPTQELITEMPID
jgi:thioredoxin 1